MKITHRVVNIAIILFATAGPASAKCVLPILDEGAETPSPPNLKGEIVAIDKDIVVIKALDNGGKIPVRISPNTDLFTEFGGYVRPEQLKVGQIARVWFVGCKQVTNSTSIAASFSIFSKDPNDRP